MRESLIEKKVCKHAESLGWFQFKMASPGTRGIPDRVFFKDGKTVLIEFKSSTGQLSPSQKYIIDKLKKHKIPVYVIKGVQSGKELFHEI